MNHKHRKALHALFAHPISGNLSMKDVEHVLKDLGAELRHANGGKIAVTLAGHTAHFHEHGHSLGKDEVVQLRKFVETCGIDPARDYPL
ncbi:MAG: hypothetical protein SFV21_07590 [Rhodospirillaceae bacterium]|nr:hypothetical protein [Rhodospirillaceae bacterium]